MFQRWVIITLLILSLLTSGWVGLSRAETVDVAVGQNSVTINMHLTLQENLTSLPKISVYLGPSNSTSVIQAIKQPIETAIQKLVPNANVASLQLVARTTNSTGMWQLEENYSMTVTGASTNLGSTIKANLAFIPMNVSESLKVADQELNAVGSAYLLAPLNAQPTQNTLYFIDGHQSLSAIIPTQTTVRFWLLDFTWVSPVSTWTSRADILGQSSTWTLDPAGPRYNLTLGLKSPEGTLLRVYMAIYNPSIDLRIPTNAWVSGNTASYNVATPIELVMPAIILASLAVLIATVFLDRKVAKPIRTRRRK